MQRVLSLLALLSVLVSVFCPAACDGQGQSLDSLDLRMHRFRLSVCDKCASRAADCGCELGDANPAWFQLLRSYSRQYDRWSRQLEREAAGQSIKWVLVDVEGGAGNQLIHMVGGLMLAISMGRPLVLRHNTPLTFPFDPVITFFDEEQLIVSGILPRAADRNISSTFTLNVFSAAGVNVLSCNNWQEELDEFSYIKFQGAYGIHLPLINMHVGPWLRETFRGIPFFFLSHFLWSGEEQRSRPVRITSRPPQTWDGTHRSLSLFKKELTMVHGIQTARLLSVHVRTDTNHPMYYFDQSHVLPHRPEAFCGGDASSLEALLTCINSLPPPTTNNTTGGSSSMQRRAQHGDRQHRVKRIVLWATDNDQLVGALVDAMVSEHDYIVVFIEHSLPGSDRHDLNCWQHGCESSGLVDLEFLGLGHMFVGSTGSTYSYVAHARALLLPHYASFAAEVQGGCATSAATDWRDGATESGLLIQHVGSAMHSDCRIVQHRATVECLSVYPETEHVPSAAQEAGAAAAAEATAGICV